MNEPLVQKLRQICLDVAHEIEPASRDGDHTLLAAAVKARDALVEMGAAAGDEYAIRVMEELCSLDEMKTSCSDAGELPTTYAELIMLLTLRPISDQIDLKNATEIIDRLAVIENPTRDQADYLFVLSILIEDYENKHFDFSNLTVIDSAKTHPETIAGYSGVGCPCCGRDADVEGDGVEIDESGARQEVTCSKCNKVWVNRYQFDGGAYPAARVTTMDTENYGHELILDLHRCDADTFTRQSIGEYFDELCELIGMQAEDRHFWDDDGVPPEHRQTDQKTCGVSAVQFILTSTIVVHTLTKLKAVYINIFSCKDFDEGAARQFTIQWFRAGQHHSTSVVRR